MLVTLGKIEIFRVIQLEALPSLGSSSQRRCGDNVDDDANVDDDGGGLGAKGGRMSKMRFRLPNVNYRRKHSEALNVRTTRDKRMTPNRVYN